MWFPENLGLAPGTVAAGSLMVDYVMTVAVSVCFRGRRYHCRLPGPGKLAHLHLRSPHHPGRSCQPAWSPESGRFFSIPTYLFVLLCGGLVVVGFIRWVMGDLEPQALDESGSTLQGMALLWIVLRAFSGGCSAMTGTEAIANAVPAFKPPESKNASITLGVMASILAFLLLGVTALAQVLHIIPQDGTTVLGEIGHAVYGGGFFYYALQIATMAILILAANTSFTGFPRLASVLARDGLMPRQFMNRGDKLVFSNGIIGLTIAAIVVLVVFRRKSTA